MKILVLAGGYDQIAFVKELQKYGHEVILADYFDNPPAKKYVKKHFQISTLDEEAIYKLAVLEKIDLITTACADQALLTVSRISERLDLPCYLSSKTAESVTNKAYMKAKFNEYGIPTSKSIVLNEESDYFQTELIKLRKPLIVKPCDCNSSKGVVKVTSENELRYSIDYAFKLSRSKKVIIEEFIEGQEISIDVWKDNIGVKIISISESKKIQLNSENFTIYQSRYPVDIADNLIEKIRLIAEKLYLAFGLNNCPILIQAIINGNEINVIEFSARMGGGSKYKFIEYMSGINIMKIYTERVLGNTQHIVNPKSSKKSIELNYVYAYNGVFDKLIGFCDALSNRDICEIFQYKLEGSLIENKITSSDRIVGFLIEDDSYELVKKKRIKLLKHLDILDNNGNSIMYKECFYQD